MRAIDAICLGVCATALSSCSTPFSTAVDDYDFGRDQARAVITLSDPQVYARETLVNDRREEVEYLGALLDDSVSIRFEPQLLRQLETVQSLVAQGQGIIDPASGSAFDREEDRRRLEQETELLRLETLRLEAEMQRVLAERNLQSAITPFASSPNPGEQAPGVPATSQSEGEPGGESPPADGTGTPPAGGSNTPPASQTTEQQQQSQQVARMLETAEVGELESLTLGDVRSVIAASAQMQNLLNRLSSNARPARINASPLEEFRDRQAYRRELRAAIADANLDDVHDIDGNSLYRLQFRATLMPGEHLGQFGAARLTFQPPALDGDDFRELYLTWLSYVSEVVNDRNHRSTGFEYELIGRQRELFDVVELSDAPGRPLRLVVTPDFSHEVRQILCGDDGVCAASTARIRRSGTTAQDQVCPQPGASGRYSLAEVTSYLDQSEAVIFGPVQGEIELALIVTMRGVARSGRGDATVEYLAQLFREISADTEFDRVQVSLHATCLQQIRDRLFDQQIADDTRGRIDGLLTSADKVRAAMADSDADEIGLTAAVIGRFREALTEDQGAALVDGQKQAVTANHLTGEMAVFGARPIEQAQRISSVQGAANALDLAFAAQARVPGQGLFGAFGSNFARQSAGRIETLERAPVVVGFSDRSSADNETCDSLGGMCPQAGWVFGPTLTPDGSGSRLRLSQRLNNHGVSADISVPGWWPWVEASVETAWIGDWNNRNTVFHHDPESSRSMRIFLPRNAADMISLTSQLGRTGAALDRPSIVDVFPADLTICRTANVVRIQAAGRNLWQGAQAFLNGAPASSIEVLPNMGGLDLVFPARGLQTLQGSQTELQIWTRDGRASQQLRIRHAAADSPFCSGSPVTASTAPSVGAISLETRLLIRGAPFRMRVQNANLLQARDDLQLEIQRVDAVTGALYGAPYTARAVDLRVLPTTGEIVWTPAAAATSGGDGHPPDSWDGDRVRMTIVLKRAPESQPLRFAVSDDLVFHTTRQAAEASVHVRSSQLATLGSPVNVEIQLPAHPDLRFPGLIPNERGSDYVFAPDVRVSLNLGDAGAIILQQDGGWTASALAGARPAYSGRFLVNSGIIDQARLEAALRDGDGADLSVSLNGFRVDGRIRSINPATAAGKLKLETPPS